MTRVLLVVFLLAVYALPLYWPPAATPLLMPGPDSDLLSRLFPGVSAAWIVVRLGCLALAAALFPVAALPTVKPTMPATRAAQPITASVVIAACLFAASFLVSHFTRPLQLLYIVALFLPGAILVMQERRWSRLDLGALLPICGITLAWLAIRVALVFHSPRIASAVDMTTSFHSLQDLVAANVNVITTGIQVGGITALHLVVEGGGILGWAGVPLTISAVLAIHLFWVSLSAVAVGLLARHFFGKLAAPIATAAFLFSPYMLATTYYITGGQLGALFSAVALLLCAYVLKRQSCAALALLAAVAGIAATHPGLVAVPLCALAFALWSMRAWNGPRLGAIAMALLVFAAACLPALPQSNAAGVIFGNVTSAGTSWAALEAGLLGQVSTHLADSAIQVAPVDRLEVALSALLTPFGIARNAIRLVGDVIIDPIAGAFAALGLGTCIRWWRVDSRARVLLGVLALAIIPAMGSSYDRPSLTRAFVLPVPLALLAAAGCDQLRRRLGLSGGVATAVMAASIATSGIFIFDVVNPAILPAAANSIALETAANSPPAARAPVILRHSKIDLEEVRTYAEVASPPLATWPLADENSLAGEPEPDVFFWSPGLEESQSVARKVCARWPEAKLYTLYDRPHLSRVFAAHPRGTQWTPALPADRWSANDCAGGLETERVVAQRALAEARKRIDTGDADSAINLLRGVAQRSFVAVELFDTLARLQLEHAGKDDLDAAAYWARRATLPKSGAIAPWLTLAEVDAARGRLDRAVVDATRALWLAKEQNDGTAQAQIEATIERYEQRAAATRAK